MHAVIILLELICAVIPVVSGRHCFLVVILSLTIFLLPLPQQSQSFGRRVHNKDLPFAAEHSSLIGSVPGPAAGLCVNHRFDTNFLSLFVIWFFSILFKVLLKKSFAFIIIIFVNIFQFTVFNVYLRPNLHLAECGLHAYHHSSQEAKAGKW